jgi:hypothetical protein
LEPLTNPVTFAREHELLSEKMRGYSLTKRGRTGLSREVLEDLTDRSSMLLRATNARSRIAFQRAASIELQRLISPSRNQPVFWVTLTPEMFAKSIEDAQTFDWSEVERWAHKVLRGFSYFGSIDVALYTASPRGREWIVVFHIHALAWGQSQEAVTRWKDYINAHHRSLIPGRQPAYVRKLESWTAVNEKLIYSLKAPLRSYRSHQGRPVEGKDEAWFHNKAKLRPGEMIAICNLLHGADIDKLCVEGGEAQGITEAIATRARQAIESEDSRRERDLLLSIGHYQNRGSGVGRTMAVSVPERSVSPTQMLRRPG